MRRRVVTVGLVAGCCLAACTPGGPETPSPSPTMTTQSSPSVIPSPSPSPPAAERDVARTFVTYWRMTDEAANRGGADQLPTDLAEYVTGAERSYQVDNLRDLKKRRFAGSGLGKVQNVRMLKPVEDDATSASLSACVDQTDLEVTQNGKPFVGKPDYLVITRASLRREKGSWKVSDVTSDAAGEGLTCANFS